MGKRKWVVMVMPLAFVSLSVAYGRQPGGVRMMAADGVDATTGSSIGGSFEGWGALGTVRSEPTRGSYFNKQISCWIDAWLAGSQVTCQVLTDVLINPLGDPSDPSNHTLGQLRCTSTNPQLITAASAINGDSMVSFWVATKPVNPSDTGQCIEIVVENGSQYSPKAYP